MVQKIDLKCGFTVKINDKILNDYKFLKLSGAIQKAVKDDTIGDKIYLLSDFIDRIYGEEQAEELEQFLADEEGFLPADVLYGVAEETLQKLDTKN